MALDNRGVIVGYGSKDAMHNLALRFIVGGKAVDLNSETDNLEDWNLVVADSVNREGAIAGIGYRADGDYHAFVLVPQR